MAEETTKKQASENQGEKKGSTTISEESLVGIDINELPKATPKPGEKGFRWGM